MVKFSVTFFRNTVCRIHKSIRESENNEIL